VLDVELPYAIVLTIALISGVYYIITKQIKKKRWLTNTDAYRFEMDNYLTEYIQGLSMHFSREVLDRSRSEPDFMDDEDEIPLPVYSFEFDPDEIELLDLILYISQVINSECYCLSVGKDSNIKYFSPPYLYQPEASYFKRIKREDAWKYLNKITEFLIFELYHHRIKNGRVTGNADLLLVYEWVSINKHWYSEGNFLDRTIEHLTLESLVDLEKNNFEDEASEYFYEICSNASINQHHFNEELKSWFSDLYS
jgi:hypothetical protein